MINNMTQETKDLLLHLMQSTSSSNANQVKSIYQLETGLKANSGCFCKERSIINLYNTVSNWIENNGN